jgi:hypothetical protein
MNITQKTKINKKKGLTIKRFNNLHNKPKLPKTGISYSIEKAENIDKNGKKMDGDIFKKYQNGILKRQIFVSKVSENKIIKKQKKLIRKQNIKGGEQIQNPPQPPVIVQNGTNIPNQDKDQPQPQVVVVQNGTNLGKEVQLGVADGVGFGIGMLLINAVFGDK